MPNTNEYMLYESICAILEKARLGYRETKHIIDCLGWGREEELIGHWNTGPLRGVGNVLHSNVMVALWYVHLPKSIGLYIKIYALKLYINYISINFIKTVKAKTTCTFFPSTNHIS